MTEICHSRHKRPLSSKLKFKTEKTKLLPESFYSVFSKWHLWSSEYTSFSSSSLKTSKKSSNEPFLPFHGSGTHYCPFSEANLKHTACQNSFTCTQLCKPATEVTLQTRCPHWSNPGRVTQHHAGNSDPTQHSPCQLGEGNAITISTGRIITPSTTLELQEGETSEFCMLPRLSKNATTPKAALSNVFHQLLIQNTIQRWLSPF